MTLVYRNHHYHNDLKVHYPSWANCSFLLAGQGAEGIAQAETTQNLVKTEAAEQTIDQTAKTKTAQLLAVLAYVHNDDGD